MQLKTIFTASAAVALALTGWQISNADTSANALDYTPRVEEAKSQAPDGAWEIQQKMLGDIETGEINSEGLRELRGEVTRFAAQQSLDGRATDHYWNEMGPDNIGGRTRAIAAVIPEDGSEETVLYAGAISGGSGSKAAKKGAGVGVIAAASRNSRNRRAASANASAQADQIVKNCMRGRGYNVLN